MAVTAHQWVPLREVPEAALPAWLQAQAAQGWTLVGVEQTAESVALQASGTGGQVDRIAHAQLSHALQRQQRPDAPRDLQLPTPLPHPSPPCLAPTPPQDFAFPRRTLLVLGREKEGIPSSLLALLHATVEIPQLGRIRSLNAHVSGAIAAWEYTRQAMRGGLAGDAPGSGSAAGGG